MSVPQDMSSLLQARYPLAFAEYNRQQLWETLISTLDTWLLKKWSRSRYNYMCRLTLDALDECEGQRLQDRWRCFERRVFPKWSAGEQNPPMGTTWRAGVNVLVLGRFILPGWISLYRLSIGEAMKKIPETSVLKQQYQVLKQSVDALRWAKNPVKRSLAVDRGIKVMLVRGYEGVAEIQEADLFNDSRSEPFGYAGVGSDILDGALCRLGVFKRTPRRNSSRRLRQRKLTIPELVAQADLAPPFEQLTQYYLEAAMIRLNWTHSHMRSMCQAITAFWQYLDQYHPEIDHPTQVLPSHGRAFIEHAIRVAQESDTGRLTTLYARLLNVRTFFNDVCLWAAEPEAKFAGYVPQTPPISRQDLSRLEFDRARKKTAERCKATIFELERELPKIRAYALQTWLLAEEKMKAEPENEALADEEANTFWNWALLELLVQSGLRVEEATELSTLDILKRRLPDGQVYYLLHVKPSKFDRARLIPIGDGLGRVIAEIIRHIKRFYSTDAVPFCDRWDFTARKNGPRAPYLFQGLGHPSVISDEVVRRRLRILSRGAEAKASDGSPLILHPHDCRRMFATEHLNNNVPIHVIQALLGHATPDTVMVYAKLYPTTLVEEYRKTVRGVYNTFHGKDSLRNPTQEEWAAFERSCSLRDMGTHVCSLPTGEYCPRGLVCLGCTHAQPKKSAAPVFRRMLASHTRELAKARERGEPAGQIAARELEIGRIRHALGRAEELTADVAAAIEAAAGPWSGLELAPELT
jgi:integrase